MAEKTVKYNYRLYQIDLDCLERDIEPAKLAFQENPNPDPKNYKLAYEGSEDVPDGSNIQFVLERIFFVHNMDDRPARDRIRSCSVSDVIVLTTPNGITEAHMVRMFGYQKVGFGLT